jgi:hypothetical protein
MIGPKNPQALPPADDDPPASRAARQRRASAGRPRPWQQAREMEEAIQPPLRLLASRRTQAHTGPIQKKQGTET